MIHGVESTTSTLKGKIVTVCLKADPGLPKLVVDSITLIADWGVEGDYHAGKFVRHRYLAKKDPQQLNLRQVLIVDSTTYLLACSAYLFQLQLTGILEASSSYTPSFSSYSTGS